MIRLKSIELDTAKVAFLETWQAEVDKKLTHAERKAEAKRLWPSKRKSVPFNELVVKALDKMVEPNGRCMFCEDNAAYQVEHFWPKAIFPQLAFEWLNFLYACGPCNGAKSTRFAILSTMGTLDLVKDDDDEPRCGRPGLLNPRYENPMEFIKLDLETFEFGYVPLPNTPDYLRAELTVTWLGLNLRSLPQQRETAYEDYLLRLREYVMGKQDGKSMAWLASREHGILRRGHITVFREMQRQWRDFPVLCTLFEAAPEAQDPCFPRPRPKSESTPIKPPTT